MLGWWRHRRAGHLPGLGRGLFHFWWRHRRAGHLPGHVRGSFHTFYGLCTYLWAVGGGGGGGCYVSGLLRIRSLGLRGVVAAELVCGAVLDLVVVTRLDVGRPPMLALRVFLLPERGRQ